MIHSTLTEVRVSWAPVELLQEIKYEDTDIIVCKTKMSM